LDLPELSYIIVVAFTASAISGFAGVGGGFLPAIFLAPIIGMKALMPALSVMLLMSNFSRSWINRTDFHKDAFLRVAIPAAPMVFLGGYFYASLEPRLIAAFLGVVILCSIPLRHWAKSRQIETSPMTLSCVGALFGFLCGSAVGPGMILIPFMLGYGLTPVNFVATLAVIATFTNIARVVSYSSLGLITYDLLIIGFLAGAATIPGNMLGRFILTRIKTKSHGLWVDILTFGGGLNFLWKSLD
jgi:uncharacterized membrane protein YfcA